MIVTGLQKNEGLADLLLEEESLAREGIKIIYPSKKVNCYWKMVRTRYTFIVTRTFLRYPQTVNAGYGFAALLCFFQSRMLFLAC